MLSGKLKYYVTSYSEEVTGSNNHVKVDWPDGRTISFLVDCGLFQEKAHNHINSEKFPYKPENISFVIATHVHTDHVGRLPYLFLNGFRGNIYCSYETKALLPVVLNETAERLEDDYRKELNRFNLNKERIKKLKASLKGKGRRDKPRRDKCTKKKKKPNVEKVRHPILIYDKKDIELVTNNTISKNLCQTFSPVDGIDVTFYSNAHMSGAVLAVVRLYTEQEEINMLFTGDLGLTNPVTKAITEIPDEVAAKIDAIICESTYGSADPKKHEVKERNRHMEIIREVHKKKGTIMYMSNSLERPLRLGCDLKSMQNDEDSPIREEMQDFSIYFDTTFGIKCLKKYEKLYGKDYLPNGFTVIDKDSRDKAIASSGPKMIICTSPRLYQGSFLNYGARMLENPNVTLIFVAYVPDEVKNFISLPTGTEVEFMGEKVRLKCKRYQFGYYSSHVSTEEMDTFLTMFPNVSTILFNHGTHDSKNNYAARYKTSKNTTHNLLYGRTVMLTKSKIEKYF